jgi:hypothetical protein
MSGQPMELCRRRAILASFLDFRNQRALSWLVSFGLLVVVAKAAPAYASAQNPAVFSTGSFDLKTTTGTQAFAHGLAGSVTPKAMIFWTGWAGPSNSDVPSGSARSKDEVAFSLGFTDGTTTTSVAYGASEYALPTNNTNGGQTRMSTTGALQVMQSDQSIISQANFSSWDGTNVTLDFATASGVGASRKWHFLAIGGSKVQAKVLSWTMSKSTTATTLSQSVTTIGFQPNVCIHLSGASEYNNAVGTGTKRADAVLTMGVADYFDQQWSIMNMVEQTSANGVASVAYHMRNASDILLYRANAGGTTLFKHVAHSAMLSNGFSVSIGTATAGNLADDTRVFTLCLQGVNSFAGLYTKVATNTTGTEAAVMTADPNKKFTPGVVIFGSDMSNNGSQANPTSKANFMFGAASSTIKEESVTIACEHAATDMECQTYDSAENLILVHENTFDAILTTDNDEAEASMSSFNSDGFTVNWSKQDNHATIYPYLALSTPYGTDVKLESFDVASNEQGRSFQWRTGYESSSLGFNIYDEHQGKRRRLTPDLIAGSALLVGAGQPLTSGRSYQWQAGPDLASQRYWLEEVSVDGKRTQYGPYLAKRGPPSNVSAISSPLLADLGHGDLLGAGLPKAGDTLSARDDAPPRPGRIEAPDDLAARAGIKLMVRQDGFFRLGADRLIAGGLDPGVDPRRLRLYADGYEVRLRVTGEDDGRLDPGDAVEFYGLGNDTLFSDARVYWLAAVGGEGPRLGGEAAPPQRSLRIGAFPFTVEDRARSLYFAALLNEDGNNFFGPVISNKAVDRHVTVHHLSRSSGAAQLRVRLQGASETSHRVTVQLNGREIGQIPFERRAFDETILDLPRDGAGLVEGDNVVSLIGGDPDDVVLFDSLRLTYPHGLVADDDAQRVTVPARRGVKLDGFSSEEVRAFDVTSPDAVIELPATKVREGQTVSVAVSPLRNGGTVLFVGERRMISEAVAIKNQPSNWRGATAGADLLIITNGSLASAVEPLRRLREQQGLVVQVIDVEDLYDEFNHGEKDPRAIRDFLQTAARTFSRRPRFVLLVGDASFDPRDYLGLGDHDLVPTKLVDTWPLETASDDWFADFAGQGVPEMAIGRLPARTLEAARAIVDKLVRHDTSSTTAEPRALVISDQNTTGNDFEAAARRAASAFPLSMPVSLRFRSQPLAPSDPPTLFDAVNGGPSVIEYFGHGSVDLWNGALSADAVAGLSNRDQLSLVVSMTCLNGFFQDARMTTMAEALLGAPDGGAFAVWASSGYTASPDQQALG